MTPVRRVAVLACCMLVALGTAWYAGTRGEQAQAPPVGTVRLGPEPGEPVADYRTRAAVSLPPAGVTVPALVGFRTEQTPADALVLAGAPLVAVLHVPLPRVQVALRFEPLEAGVAPGRALDSARQRARHAAQADAARLTGRPAAVAAAEAAGLADPGCRCVLAVLVLADRAGLDELAAAPAVRAVEAAPAGTTPGEIAVLPLLPGQLERADPLPDDGPVPPA